MKQEPTVTPTFLRLKHIIGDTKKNIQPIIPVSSLLGGMGLKEVSVQSQ